MRATAKFLGHPIHQMLIVFPLGLLATSLAFDILYFATGSGGYAAVAYWMVTAGLIGGFLAAPFGFLDWLAIPHYTRARRIGAIHGIGNGIVLGFFICSWVLRYYEPLRTGAVAFVFSLLGLVLMGATGWLGAELVDVLGVGVAEHPDLNAPNSLTGRVEPERATRDMKAQEEKFPGHHAVGE